MIDVACVSSAGSCDSYQATGLAVLFASASKLVALTYRTVCFSVLAALEWRFH